MRINDLSTRSGVPHSAIKFYIREGLLPRGNASAPNQADYGLEHLDRLALISTLREVAGLSLEAVRRVLDELEGTSASRDPVGAALEAASPLPERDRTESEEREFARVRIEIERVMLALDWVLEDASKRPRHLHLDRLTDALLQIRRHVDPAYPVERLGEFGACMGPLVDVAFRGFENRAPNPDDDLTEATRFGLVGILLLEPIVTSLLRSALVMRSIESASSE